MYTVLCNNNNDNLFLKGNQIVNMPNILTWYDICNIIY